MDEAMQLAAAYAATVPHDVHLPTLVKLIRDRGLRTVDEVKELDR